MNRAQLVTVAASMADQLREHHDPQRAPTDQPGAPRDRQRAHCLWMLEQIPALVEENRLEKAHTWVGFAQGVLWSLGHHSIDQFRDANRSDTDTE